MNIEMIGIDHTMASIDYRQIFSFTKAQQGDAMQAVCDIDGITGCVIISTCNRMEMYISTEDGTDIDMFHLLCSIKDVPAEKYESLFVIRKGIEAAEHLFSLAAGMESRIVGEEQILMQVKEALSWSREWDATDKVLEVLFRMAVTEGKRIRTELTFSRENSSAVYGAMMQLQQMGYTFESARCLVIGNGQMGKLTATILRELGADVTVTVRQYRSGIVEIPEGCGRINYSERYESIPRSKYIISATKSPNMTITKKDIEDIDLFISDIESECDNVCEKVFIDMAVPRDIDPAIAEIKGVRLFDIDSFEVDRESKELKLQIAKAQTIINETLDEFISWYECRDFIPMIKDISNKAAKDVSWRMEPFFQKTEMEREEMQKLENAVVMTSQKVLQKLMFELRDQVSTDVLRECLEAFRSAYPEVKTS